MIFLTSEKCGASEKKKQYNEQGKRDKEVREDNKAGNDRRVVKEIKVIKQRQG